MNLQFQNAQFIKKRCSENKVKYTEYFTIILNKNVNYNLYKTPKYIKL